ncbi:trypsin-like serine peptidase [Kitasatospora sp. NPDC096147]|uniref:trypsin-like serine peptidase n=1 Tax=Kitasatospora sp. NPDC096147 TaxID=3364093 RepID=UPI00381F91A0
MGRIRRTVTAVLVGTALLTGCGSTAGAPSHDWRLPSADTGKWKGELTRRWDELKTWRPEDWDRWAREHVFRNPVVRGLWEPEKMTTAEPQQPGPPITGPATAEDPAAQSPSDPEPAAVEAVAVDRPYTRYPASGKVFSTAPGGGTGQCSATVVADPARPGRSNLVWTAGHCVHEGAGGGWFRNLIFVPAYNSSGLAGTKKKPTMAEVAPLGQWWADQVISSPQWIAEGGHSGNAANQYDFAVLRVHNPDGDGRSLEEAVGTAVPVWFDAPRALLTDVAAWGYPSAKPYDGRELNRCDGGRPARLSFDPTRPAMLSIGCTMTAGSSGGGWFATMPDGRTALVSNTSIGNLSHTALNGPYLESVARQALEYVSRKG